MSSCDICQVEITTDEEYTIYDEWGVDILTSCVNCYRKIYGTEEQILDMPDGRWHGKEEQLKSVLSEEEWCRKYEEDEEKWLRKYEDSEEA